MSHVALQRYKQQKQNRPGRAEESTTNKPTTTNKQTNNSKPNNPKPRELVPWDSPTYQPFTSKPQPPRREATTNASRKPSRNAPLTRETPPLPLPNCVTPTGRSPSTPSHRPTNRNLSSPLPAPSTITPTTRGAGHNTPHQGPAIQRQSLQLRNTPSYHTSINNNISTTINPQPANARCTARPAAPSKPPTTLPSN